jgi:hypothetical protein
LWLTAVFIGLLALFAVTPDPARTAAERPDTASEPTRAPGECIVCGIDQQCDPTSGRCVFLKSTPLPCVEHAEFDEKAGFCLPTGAPTPVPEPESTDPFAEFDQRSGIDRRPGDSRAERDSDRDRDRDDDRDRDNDFPFNDENDNDGRNND